MRIAIATCEGPTEFDHQSELVTPVLERMGHSVEKAVWADPAVDWAFYDAAWISSTWDYFNRPDEFREWIARAGVATRLHNPRVLVDWNIDKRYLRELGGAGVPIVQTVWTMPELAASAAETVGDLGWEKVVVKPTVDGGAFNLKLVDPGDVAAAVEGVGGPAMIQPFLPSVAEEGELSLIFFRGELSHAVHKAPKAGDFRVQEHWGGVFTQVDPPPEALAAGRVTLAAMLSCSPIDEMPLYARVDLVRDPQGMLCTIELEVIEPSLYLEHVGPEKTEHFARLLSDAAG